MIKNTLLKSVMLLVIILACSHYFAQLPSVQTFNAQWVDAHTRDNGAWGIINYMLVGVTLLCLGVPRQLVAFLGGYAFGFFEGLIYSTAAALISCIIVFYISRLYARPVLTRFFSNKIAKIDSFLDQAPIYKSTLIRLLPVGNNLMTNIFAGVTKIKASSFFLGSVLGYLPQMLIFSLMGKGIVINSQWNIVISILIFTLSSLLGLRLVRDYRRKPDTDKKDIHRTNKNTNIGSIEL